MTNRSAAIPPLEDLGKWGADTSIPDHAFRRVYLVGTFEELPFVLRAVVLVPSYWTLNEVRASLRARHWHDIHASFDIRTVAPTRMGF